MKIIIITSPEFIPGEVSCICRLLDCGAYRVHLRKPAASIDEYENLIRQIPQTYLNRIVIHDYFSLSVKYHLAGIHLNSRSHDLPAGFGGSVSCSCHTLAEVAMRKSAMDYLFLSPVFDSISKENYPAAFSPEMLHCAAADGIIDAKVMALGGVTFSSLERLASYAFGGAVMLGEIWQHLDDKKIEKLCNQLQNVRF